MNEKSVKRALISLGSNLGDRQNYLKLARQAISKENRILKESSELNNAALIITDQPDFLNQIIEIETTLSPEELLDFLKETEKQLGRKSRERYGPREIDLDILDYEGIELSTDRLTLPHPGLQDRKYLHQLLAEPILQSLSITQKKKRFISLCNHSLFACFSVPLFSMFLRLLISLNLILPIFTVTAQPSNSEPILIEQSSPYYHSAPESEEIQNLYSKLKDGFSENDIQSIDAATLNQVAVIATTNKDLDNAESLFRFSIQKLADPTYSLLIRLNLIYLYLNHNLNEADLLLSDLFTKANEKQRLFIYHGLTNRKFDSTANQLLRQWLNSTQISDELIEASLETAVYFKAIGKIEISISLLEELDSRTTGTNTKIIGLLASSNPDSKKAIDYYKRLFNLKNGQTDEAYRHYASLQLQESNLDEANLAFSKIANLKLTDIRSWAVTRLKQNPTENIEPILAKAQLLPLDSFESESTELWPNSLAMNVRSSPAQFYDLFHYTNLLAQQSTVVQNLRIEIYGTSDIDQIAKDRQLIEMMY